MAHDVGAHQRTDQVVHRQADTRNALRVELDVHDAVRRTDGVDVAGAGNALQLTFERVRDPRQLVGATRGIARPQGDRQHRHVVDALRLDHGLQPAQRLRPQVEVRIDGIVEADNRLVTRQPDLELDREDGQAGSGHRIQMLDVGNLGQHLLHWLGNEALDLGGAGSRKGDHHVRHGHVDLRLLLPRRHQHREQAQQQGSYREQRGQLMG